MSTNKESNHRINQNLGTPSGGSSQEDPPTGGSGTPPGLMASEGGLSSVNAVELRCNFSVLRHVIKPGSAPLFDHYGGIINCYLPFDSYSPVEDDKKEYVIQPDRSHRQALNGLSNAYMSEVVFLYREENTTLDEDCIIRPVINRDRNHVFLSQTFWFEQNHIEPMTQETVRVSTEKWGIGTRPGESKTQYIIHEIRPVYLFDDWTSEQTRNIKIDTIARPHDDDESYHWLIIARPRKYDLKERNNRYAIGIVSTPKKEKPGGPLSIPQLCQDVDVYGYSNEDISDKVKIKDESGNVRATLEIVPFIELSNHVDHFIDDK